MSKQSFLYLLLFLAGATKSISQKVNMHPDETGRMNLDMSAPSRTVSAQQVTITASLDEHFPESQVHLQLSFSEIVNLNEVKYVVVVINKGDDIRFSKVLFFSNKAIDKVNRSLTTSFGGLKPDQLFAAQVFLHMNDAQYNTCNGDQVGQITFTTAKESVNRQKKLLFVIDKEMEGDTDIDNAITAYINDITPYYGIIFEKIYLENQNVKKNELMAKIRTDYANTANPLRYLFFLGSNATTQIRRQFLNPANNTPVYTYYDLSVNFYTQLYAPEFYYDSTENMFVQKTYQYCTFSGFPANDIGNSLCQSNSFDLAFGAVIPNGPTPKKEYILNYFTKLHQFKKGNITFNKSVLFADTQFHDGGAPAALSAINPRWQVNDTINVPQKFGPDFHGYDPVWNQDYTSKLATGSYEICMFMGHGAPTFHYYGISNSTIRNLPNLNTMAFDFNACSVGAFNEYDYVAGAYLEKGNTLFVKAYTTSVGIAVFEFRSPLIDYFREGSPFSDISKRAFFGDSYLYNNSSLIVQINLGDPLLQIDPPCAVNTLALTNPFNNINGTTVVAAENSITAQNKIISSPSTSYQAGNAITLQNGFEVAPGAIFNARIIGCPD
ncbi:3-coathanger stack domain-containing protein [Runella sp.]|uniref:3-coathanger stack domain-containing protein n=1 Tax=Runella sp. TaxID=1960881 RepID=UPI003D13071B